MGKVESSTRIRLRSYDVVDGGINAPIVQYEEPAASDFQQILKGDRDS